MAQNPFGPGGFTDDQIPDQSGRTIAITGANSGIGFEAARLLGRRGAHILMLCRNREKAEAAKSTLSRQAETGRFTIVDCDLADLSSVRNAADAVTAGGVPLDALLCNAGVMFPPKRRETTDGFELQFGVNVLGHFALAARLSPLVEQADGRFVWVGSMAHHFARGVPFDDLQWEDRYRASQAYAVSKLADIMLALEAQRRLATAGSTAISLACHPGYADTNLQSTSAGPVSKLLMKPMNALFAQSAERGALPLCLAVASLKAHGGGYYGPTGFLGFTGAVGPADIAGPARDEAAARRLWSVAEGLTGERWSIGASAPSPRTAATGR